MYLWRAKRLDITEMDWKEALGALVPEDFPAPQEQEEEVRPDSCGDRKTDTLRIVIDRKQRKGKTATIVEGFSCDEEELKRIARDLKTRVGAGGSARGGEILVQGDCGAKVAEALRGMGYKVKF